MSRYKKFLERMVKFHNLSFHPDDRVIFYTCYKRSIATYLDRKLNIAIKALGEIVSHDICFEALVNTKQYKELVNG